MSSYELMHGSQENSSDSDDGSHISSKSMMALGSDLHQQSSHSPEKIETDQDKTLHAIMTELDNIHTNMNLNFSALRAMINQLDQKVTNIDQRLKQLEPIAEKKGRCVSFDETRNKKN